MGVITKEIGPTGCHKVKENIIGLTAENTQDHGTRACCMAKGCLNGPMEKVIRVILKMTRNRGLALILGLTERNMKVSGKMEFNMEKGCLPI